jgi:hypothetical protein
VTKERKRSNQLKEILGWYGMTAIVLAYSLISFSLISSNSFYYQFLNLTGSLGIILVALGKKDYQPVVLNIIWMIIAVIAIVRLIF